MYSLSETSPQGTSHSGSNLQEVSVNLYCVSNDWSLHVNSSFFSVGMSYFTVFYITLDKLVSQLGAASDGEGEEGEGRGWEGRGRGRGGR